MLGCSREDPSFDHFRNLAARGAPLQFCTDRPPAPATAFATTVVVDTAVQGFQPARVVDLAIAADSTIYVLDAGSFTVARLNFQGGLLGTWGRQGHGPGEFVNPQAIATHRDRVYVLDSNQRVTVFDLAGTYVRDVLISSPGQDIAITSNGDLVVAGDLRQFGGEPGGVMQYDSLGRKMSVLVGFDRNTYGERPVSGPHFTPLRVFAGADGRVAVAYVTDNSVDIYRDHRLVASIRGCLPDDVLKFYRTLLKHNRGAPPMRRYQSYRIVINGVYLDASGDIYVGEPGGWDDLGHLTRYDSTGKPLDVLEFEESEPIRFASEATFLTPTDILAWDGSIWRWIVHPKERT